MAEASWCLVGLAEPLQMQSHDRCKDILPLFPAGTKSGHSRWTDDECRLPEAARQSGNSKIGCAGDFSGRR